MLGGHAGPVIAASDYMQVYADQIREFIPRSYRTFGTDGFGRSDSRVKLRQFFEVSRNFICLGALKSLADEGTIDNAVVTEAITTLGIDPEKGNPRTI
jgi:pyruvate dehydrogenase E1 component